jgi:heptosyltransferase III
VQGPGACVPCHLEGCERSIASFSDCLLELPAAKAIAAIEHLLESGTA